jgi:hypothetical protein
LVAFGYLPDRFQQLLDSTSGIILDLGNLQKRLLLVILLIAQLDASQAKLVGGL